MPPKQKGKKPCFICLRSIENDRLLGPLITTKTITAHFLCVLFNPVTPDAEDFATPEKDGGICGLSARYIREQAGRAAKLKCNFCKRNGANAGCCFDIGTNEKEKYCPKRYHIDCGHESGASFNVSKGRGAVSVCFEHRDEIERAPERSNSWLQRHGDAKQPSPEPLEYDYASSNHSEATELEGAVGFSRAEIQEGDVEYLHVELLADEHQIASPNHSEAAELEGAVGYSRAELQEGDVKYLHIEYLVDEHQIASPNHSEAAELEGAVVYSRAEIQEGDADYSLVEYVGDEVSDVQPIDGTNGMVKDESFDLNPIRESLDATNDSDCFIVSEDEQTVQNDDK